MDLRQTLFDNRDLKYKDFHTKLVPNISPDRFIGVRVPVIRKIARQAFKENAYNPCEYYEEVMVKGITMGMKKCSICEHINDIGEFVPLIDNWAICDSCATSFKFISDNLPAYYDFIKGYVGKGEYETRFAVVMLMSFYINDEYIDEVLEILKSIKSDKYYVNMAVAWALSVTYVKFKDKTQRIIESRCLSPWVQNKSIQKIRESFRVSSEDKPYLTQFKI